MLLVCRQNEIIELRSAHLPLGILNEESFNDRMDIIEINKNDQLILSTDGLLETRNGEGFLFVKYHDQGKRIECIFPWSV